MAHIDFMGVPGLARWEHLVRDRSVRMRGEPGKKRSSTVLYRGPKDHINIRILHSGSKAQEREIPETMVSSILVLMCPFGRRLQGGRLGACFKDERQPSGIMVI